MSAHHNANNSNEELLRRLEMTIEKAPIGIANVSPTGQFLMVNANLCEMLGYSQPELMRKRFQELTHEDDLAEDVAHVNDLLAGKVASYSMEKRYIRKDKTMVWANLTVSLIRNSDKSPAYFISIIEDITMRKRMEADLQRSEHRVQLLQALPGVGSWELNLDSGKCNWSRETYELLEEEPSVQPSLAKFLELVHPEDRDLVENTLEEAVSGRKEYNLEFRVVTPRKNIKHIVARGRVFYNLGDPVLSGVAWEHRGTEYRESHTRRKISV